MRDGSFLPTLLEPRKRAERALVAVVQEEYIRGVSTRRVDELVKSLGMTGISKSQVSRLCGELDTEVERFRTRRLDGPYPYVCLDATYLKVRTDGRVRSMAVVIAIAVNARDEPMCWPNGRFRTHTGGRSGVTIRWSGSTGRSNGGLMSWGSCRTKQP